MKRKKQPHPIELTAPQQPASRLSLAVSVEIMAIFILAGIPFALGKFFEFNQPDPFDGGAYTYSAWHVYQGARLGQDEVISAQPGTFLTNYTGVALFGFSELGPEIIQTLLQLAALWMMYWTLRQCFGKIAAIVCTAMASIYLSAPVIAKYGNVKEQYMIAFLVMAACCLILTIKTKKEWMWLVTGAFAVWPYYFKPTGLSILAAAGLCVIFLSVQKRSWIVFFNRLIFLSVGAVLGISPLLLFFISKIGKPHFLNTLPLLLARVLIILSVVGYAVIGVVWINRRFGLISRLKTVRTMYWLSGAAGIAVLYVTGIIIVRIQEGAIGDDIWNYLFETPFFGWTQYVYYRIHGMLHQLWQALGTNDIYITGSRSLMNYTQQAPMVLRYYAVLKLPIVMSLVSIAVFLTRLILRCIRRIHVLENQDWIVLVLAWWWIFDMVLIWVSPRSYEQYYLPMCASGSMLGGYGIWLFMKHLNPAGHLAGKIVALPVLLVMIIMVWPIFAGISHSPFSGQAYGQPSRGYVQSWISTQNRRRGSEIGPWEKLSDHIRAHSGPQDRIYVWGWYPGIYVRAQRLSASPKATEGNMHIMPPDMLSKGVKSLLSEFAKNPPKFIVDTRKREFPWNVPPLELWPQFQGSQKGFLSTDPAQIKQFEKMYSGFLAEKASPEEAKRFEMMKPLRDYVMQNYKIAGVFGVHVLFERTK